MNRLCPCRSGLLYSEAWLGTNEVLRSKTDSILSVRCHKCSLICSICNKPATIVYSIDWAASPMWGDSGKESNWSETCTRCDEHPFLASEDRVYFTGNSQEFQNSTEKGAISVGKRICNGIHVVSKKMTPEEFEVFVVMSE